MEVKILKTEIGIEVFNNGSYRFIPYSRNKELKELSNEQIENMIKNKIPLFR